MLVKTSELSGVQLDWAVAKAEGHDAVMEENGEIATFKTVLGNEYKFLWEASTNWAQGGPIIEREWIELSNGGTSGPISIDGGLWVAYKYGLNGGAIAGKGPTPLIAAMRCYVASKLGAEVEVPKEELV